MIRLIMNLRLPMRRALFLLFFFLAGCATRAPYTDANTPHPDSLDERTSESVFLAWRSGIGRYLDREGKADPSMLLQTTDHHSRQGLRPARITFGVLAVGDTISSPDGLDVNGLLLAKRTICARDWYLFLVGVVQRSRYRPTGILDLRLIGFTVERGELLWRTGAASPRALLRYGNTFSDSPPIRFPGDTGRFVVETTGCVVSVREMQSGTGWSLRLDNVL